MTFNLPRQEPVKLIVVLGRKKTCQGLPSEESKAYSPYTKQRLGGEEHIKATHQTIIQSRRELKNRSGIKRLARRLGIGELDHRLVDRLSSKKRSRMQEKKKTKIKAQISGRSTKSCMRFGGSGNGRITMTMSRPFLLGLLEETSSRSRCSGWPETNDESLRWK